MSAKRKERSQERPARAPIIADVTEPETAPETDAALDVAHEPEPAVVAPQAPVYRVAKGRSLTSPRGILDAGTVLDPARDGISDIEALVACGAVVVS